LKANEIFIHFKQGMIPKVTSFLDMPRAAGSKMDKTQVSWW